jgi:S-layer homology domain
MRKILSTFSLLLLLNASSVSVSAQTAPNYAIQKVVSAKIMSNYPDGKFHPQKSVTRAELAAIIVKTFQLDKDTQDNIDLFPIPSDINKNHWGYDDILLVLKNGIMKGYKGTKFYPNHKVTRAEAFAILAQAHGLPQFSEQSIKAILNKYPDAKYIPGWARKSMAIALNEGFVNLKNGKIDPRSPITREDMAIVINKYLQHHSPNNLSRK